MLTKVRQGWEISENQAISEPAYYSRRDLVKSLGFAGLASALPNSLAAAGTGDLFPAERNSKYTLDRPITPEKVATGYNNFYEFTLDKQRVIDMVDRFKVDPWKVKVKGLVNNPKTYDLDDILRRFPMEERLYRFRCVETWAMAVPWTGIPMSALIKEVDPQPAAKYMKMVTAFQPNVMPGIVSQPHYDWPYVEALTIEEAMNELALFGTGIFGKPLPKQNGAPFRAIIPWKYGLKNIKSIVQIEFTKKRPATLWNKAASTEYGWYSNVNPKRPHPRWSQAMDRVIPTGEMRPTLPYNGYEQYVGGLYKGNEF